MSSTDEPENHTAFEACSSFLALPIFGHFSGRAIMSKNTSVLLGDYVEAIARNFRTGKAYPEIDAGIRGRVIASHLIIYRSAASGTFEILRILHRRMDLKSKLHDDF